jgi:hypothetical protein
MTIIEAGVIAGMPAGATIGGILCKSHSILGVAGGLIAGTVLGAAGGWLYALMMIFLLSVTSVLWRAARRRADELPAEPDMELMTPIAICGIMIGVLIALVGWLSFGWLQALTAAIAIGWASSVIAIARCEFR